MKKYKNIMIKYEWLCNILLLCSVICFNLVVTLGEGRSIKYFLLADIAMIGGICGYFLFRKHLFIKILELKPIYNFKIISIISLFLAICSNRTILNYFSVQSSFFKSLMMDFVALSHIDFSKIWFISMILLHIIIIPFLFLIWYMLIYFCLPKITLFFKSFSLTEKRYFIVSSIITFILSIAIMSQTSAFTMPIPKEKNDVIYYDVLYTTDNGVQLLDNSFENFGATENDLRQPLFAAFSFPAGLASELLTESFAPLSPMILYPFFIVYLQCLALIVSSILLSRMIGGKKRVYALILYSVMFATIFFAFNVEQYVFGLFWLMLLLYYFVEKEKSNPILFGAATGCLITNAILLPFLVFQKDIKKFIIEGIKYGFIFLFIVALFGQAHNIYNGLADFGRYTGAMGGSVSFENRLLQYINFIASCFVAPKAMVDMTRFEYVSYQLEPVNSIHIFGLCLLILMIISFLLNYKKKIAKVSFGWLVFSFVILCLIGWGTAENGLIIYGIYFSWACFILIYLLLDKLLSKVPKVRPIVWGLLIAFMVLINGNEFLKIIDFGREYYPFQL